MFVRKLLGVLLAASVMASACSSDSDGGSSSSTSAPDGEAQVAAGNGLIPESEWRARQDDYLAFATEGDPPTGGHIEGVIAWAERARRDADFSWDPNTLDTAELEDTFAKLEGYEDTGDFDINRFLYLLAGYGDELPDEYRTALEERVLAFKYWWTEPTPDGIVDSQYYWTENHQIIFLANEYVAGQLYPDETFTNSGMTGGEHIAHAEPLIRSWIDHRARFGFSEWLSNVYFMEDLKGLLLLAEWSDDEEIATLAAMTLDLLFVEMASHTQAGAFGSTHGRSYMKDKMTALDEDNFSLSKMLFDDTDYPYQGVDNAVLLATANRYRPAEVVRRIAASEGPDEVRQRQSLPIDYLGPVEADPVPPFDMSYEGDAGLMTWWGMGAQFPWPMVPTSVETMAEYDLWLSDNFKRAGDLQPIVESSTTEELQQLAINLGRQLNAGLLSEVNTYTWRHDDVMLSTAQCWRPGDRSEQAHIWQATLDANAQVFTTHPREPLPDTTDWHTNSGYWTGEGALPCSVQYENVGISAYAPAYISNPGLTGDFVYEDYTHAYFPTEHFDEVVERDGWVIGRKGDGYVALWSWRPTEWRQYDPATEPTNGLTEPFDLLAPGGPDNVWVVEVGRAGDWQFADHPADDPFATFVEEITAAAVQVEQVQCPEALGRCAVEGFSVTYESPTRGHVEFVGGNTLGEDPPKLVVDGEIGLDGYPRHATPWSQADMNTKTYEISADGWELQLDFDQLTRTATAP